MDDQMAEEFLEALRELPAAQAETGGVTLPGGSDRERDARIGAREGMKAATWLIEVV